MDPAREAVLRQIERRKLVTSRVGSEYTRGSESMLQGKTACQEEGAERILSRLKDEDS